MIVLKQLAREFKCDPHKLRKMLREKFKTPKGRRWQFKPDSKELSKIRTYLSNALTKSKTRAITQGASPASNPTIKKS